MSRRHLGPLVMAAIATAGCGAPDPLRFELQGLAHYGGKRFADLTGKFESLVLAPRGDQVAFRGRNSLSASALFVAPIDGVPRQVAEPGTFEGLVAWAADGRTLYYMDSVPRPDGQLDGGTIQRLDLATGAVAQALYGVPRLAFFPAPDGASLLVAGEPNAVRTPPEQRQHHLHGPAGDTPVAPGVTRMVQEPGDAAWSADGRRVALAVKQGDYGQGPVAIHVAAAPGWADGPEAPRVFSGRYSAMAWADDATLAVYDVVVGDDLVTTRLDAAGRFVAETRFKLDTPPPGTRYRYERPRPGPGGRVLLTRGVSDVETNEPLGPREHFVVDGDRRLPVPASEDLEPVGWCGPDRLLFLAGFYQDRRPVFLAVGGPS